MKSYPLALDLFYYCKIFEQPRNNIFLVEFAQERALMENTDFDDATSVATDVTQYSARRHTPVVYERLVHRTPIGKLCIVLYFLSSFYQFWFALKLRLICMCSKASPCNFFSSFKQRLKLSRTG